MPLGIRPTNDYAFKRTFGTPENRVALISLLNAILDLSSPIVEVTLANPFNLQDFKDDKLSILDIKAVDRSGAIYDVEMQLTTYEGLVQRIVFHGCELYAGQLESGDECGELRPVYTIWLVYGILWPDATCVHHVFRFTDTESGRILARTVELHTLELERYTLREADLATKDTLDCWLYWFLHAHEYDPEALVKLLPQPEIRQATGTLARIAQISEDKAMYDARERAIRDRRSEINAARREGKIEAKVDLIRRLQAILNIPASTDQVLQAMDLPQLESLADNLQSQIRNRMSS